MAVEKGQKGLAEKHYLAALVAREEAHDRDLGAKLHADSTEQCDNLTYRAGVLCNLGHLYRIKGEIQKATLHYVKAIRELRSLIPKHKKKLERELCDSFARHWEMLHGLPHYTRVATQFLENAVWGKKNVSRKDV